MILPRWKKQLEPEQFLFITAVWQCRDILGEGEYTLWPCRMILYSQRWVKVFDPGHLRFTKTYPQKITPGLQQYLMLSLATTITNTFREPAEELQSCHIPLELILTASAKNSEHCCVERKIPQLGLCQASKGSVIYVSGPAWPRRGEFPLKIILYKYTKGSLTGARSWF